VWHVSGSAAICTTYCWRCLLSGLQVADPCSGFSAPYHLPRGLVACVISSSLSSYRLTCGLRQFHSTAVTDRPFVPALDGDYVLSGGSTQERPEGGGSRSERFEVYTTALLKMRMRHDVWVVRQCRWVHGSRRCSGS
jgi:hypothetical protein